MATKIDLKRERFSKKHYGYLRSYYDTVPSGPEYIEKRWIEWTRFSQRELFSARKADNILGFVIFNRQRSTIEEVFVLCGRSRRSTMNGIIDAIIRREHLVAAEVLASETERYTLFMDYGFRPAGHVLVGDMPVIKMELSTAVLMKKLKDAGPFRPYKRMETVAIEKVTGSKAYGEIKEGLGRLLDKLGGIKKFVRPGQTVVIKPNIVSDHGLKGDVVTGGIVTDIRVVKALVEIVLPLAKTVTIAEGSSINRSETKKMFAHYGYDDIVRLNPGKVRLVDLNADEVVEKSVPGGKRMQSRRVPVTLENADVIVSMPVLKIHFAAGVSLAIKNLQGAMPPLEKYMTHFFGLWQNLVNIHHLVKPDLIIIDGLTGSEDFGPISGTPKKMDILIGGRNPVAVDATAMRVMGIDPVSSPPVWTAWMQGLGPLEEKRINVVGNTIGEVRSPFRQPDIDITGGRNLNVYGNEACPGCRGYLHFVLSKLRRPDPADASRLLIDRPFEEPVNIYLGPEVEREIDPGATNIFMGLCQCHNAASGTHLPGCPPHAEAIMNGIFGLFPDVERPKYADETEEAKLGKMLDEILKMSSGAPPDMGIAGGEQR